MSPEQQSLEDARLRLEKLQAGSSHYTLNDIALTHIEAAIGALEDRDRMNRNSKNKN